jgi:hypothetical protein
MLLGRRWTVLRPKEIEWDGDQCLGLCHGRDRILKVISGAKGEAALEILAHEMTHAGILRSGLSEDEQERVALAMEHVMIDFLRAVVRLTPARFDYERSAERREVYRRYNASAAGRERARRREQTLKGRARRDRYNESLKGRIAKDRYKRSLKGKDRA